jgi:uncharacterized protein with GYD domain
VEHLREVPGERKGEMSTYISLMKLTEQGAKDIKEAPARLENAIKLLESLGGKLVDFFVVMGEYDYIGIAEAPNDEVAVTFLLYLGAAGNVRTTTLKAFKLEEFVQIVKKMS